MLNRNDVFSVVLDAMTYCHNTSCKECAHRVEGTARVCVANHITDYLMEMGFVVEPVEAVVTLNHKNMYMMYAALATLETSAAIMENVNGCRTLSTLVKDAHDKIAAICKEEDV